MKVTVNGEQQEVPSGLNVATLLDLLGIRAERVAIERNFDVLPRDRWVGTEVAPGDSFEIVHFVGGG
ncbi:MAG TPA: sulfur carrier protein ThiS [Candidatus Acidoferrales bacterium]|nr:sulfur carrier protein ThiS [Candidatus Acidoferrales bacterium]